MTRQHFQLLADNLARVQPDFGEPAYATWKRSLEAVADACYEANHRFDYERFYKAAGATEGYQR